ncbi:MAG: hypothetical protein ACXAEN_27100 [Candidatus Thorarchaeota archaeon]
MKRKSFFKGIPRGDWTQWKALRQQTYREYRKKGFNSKQARNVASKRMRILKRMQYKKKRKRRLI